MYACQPKNREAADPRHSRQLPTGQGDESMDPFGVSRNEKGKSEGLCRSKGKRRDSLRTQSRYW